MRRGIGRAVSGRELAALPGNGEIPFAATS
jgi:hypothetical protein